MVESLREKLEALLSAQRLGLAISVKALQIEIEEMYEFEIDAAYENGFVDGRDEGYSDGYSDCESSKE